MGDDGFRPGFDSILKRPVSYRGIPDPVLAQEPWRSRYLRAAQSHAGLHHPNVLAIYEVQPEWLVTERVEGVRLSEFLQVPYDRRAFSRQLQEMFIPQLLSGLDYAHQQGLVHRALTPDWIWLFPDDQLKLWGFGLALVEAEMSLENPWDSPGLYFSPEQTRGEPADARSDIWSVGVLLYFMCSGKLPFQGGTLTEAIEDVLLREPVPLSDLEGVEIPRKLEQAILRCLRKSADERFQCALEIWDTSSPGEIRVQPEEASHHHKLASNYFAQARYPLARLEWRKAVQCAPSELAYKNNLGVACWRGGEISEALAWLEEAQSFFNLGLLLRQLGKHSSAREVLHRSCAFMPHFAAGYLLLGECLLELHELPQALEELHKALLLNPDSGPTFRALAEVYGRMGREEEAIAYREMALERGGTDGAIEPLLMEPP